MTAETVLQLLGSCVVISPCLLVAVLGIAALLRQPLSEEAVSRWMYGTVGVGLLAAVAVMGWMLATGLRAVTVDAGHPVVIPEQHFHFHLEFLFDRLSVPFVTLSFVLCGTIGAFTNRYLHRESGYGRFYMFYALFFLGVVWTSLAGTIEVLFLGWELVGLSSALLVAFFHERQAPVRNGLRVWSVYRLADAAFVIGALTLHHLTGEADFQGLMGAGVWPDAEASLTSNQALFVGSLLLVAAAGKSALVPFCGWLPRAMEGPTPSSAIFYGALSVHLGAFLLLRVSPLLSLSFTLSVAVVTIGLLTAALAALAARVQTDIKSALAFASLTQVGIIVAEIGFGLRYIALIHIIGHACLRTLQLLRAPTLLHDYHTLTNAIGGHLNHQPGRHRQLFPRSWRTWVYRFALERGYLDALLNEWLVIPFLAAFRACDAMERRWIDFLSRGHPRAREDLPNNDEITEATR